MVLKHLTLSDGGVVWKLAELLELAGPVSIRTMNYFGKQCSIILQS